MQPDMQDIFIATVSAEVGTATSGTAISTIGLFSPANMLVVCLCATAMLGLVQVSARSLCCLCRVSGVAPDASCRGKLVVLTLMCVGCVQARRMKQRQGGSAEEKMPLYSAPAVNNGAISQSPATLV